MTGNRENRERIMINVFFRLLYIKNERVTERRPIKTRTEFLLPRRGCAVDPHEIVDEEIDPLAICENGIPKPRPRVLKHEALVFPDPRVGRKVHGHVEKSL